MTGIASASSRRWARFVPRRAGEEFEPIRRAWCLGEEAFRKQLLEQMKRPAAGRALRRGTNGGSGSDGGTNHRGRIEATAVAGSDLKARPKGDSTKVALAARLRAETTLTVSWIAERLGMGARGYLNHLLYRQRRSGTK